MNENETDPRPADSSSESSSPEPVQSEQPTVAVQPHAAPQWSAPVSAAPQSAAPQSAAPQSAAPQPGSPWQQPQHPQPPQPAQAHPQSPWQQPGYHQQPQPAYAGYQQYAQQPAYAGAWNGGAQPQPGVETDPHGQAWSSAEGQPIWAVPVGTDQRPPSNGRGRKIFVAGAAAVLIALGAGGVGAATALAFDKGSGNSPKVQTGSSSVTRVVDRSSLAQIASAVQDSVVSITTESGEGSGVILSADGYIVTNNHVVATAQGSTVTVIFADGKKMTATIVGTDPRTDLAVVKATGASGLHAAQFGSSANMQVGDTVLAIGSPLGLEGSVTAGIISAKDRTIQSSGEDQGQQNPLGQQQQGASTTMSGLLQTDAPINPGNSGGALVNTNGQVIGINSAIATQGQSSGNIGLGFAIPSDKVKQVADDLMAGKKVSHPALGVSVADAENGGALVSTVAANSAAAKAGLQQGDVITSVDGKAIDNSNDLVAAVQGGTVGQKMAIEFTRDGAKKQVTVTLAEAQ
ncbi:S1C family serine protease [Actinoplanes subtropicus]|uniref:S1C family serine protease n=1 Tax=Actinoplanes subtropicus TaxID=543632 RepID=UPI0004C47893|nr:trypsin-like peptidase domain-containing protein [Actinoplanes subtropicus]